MVSEGNIPPAGSESPAGDGGRMKSGPDTIGDTFSDAGRHVADALAYARAYVTAQADRLKVLARNAILMAVFGIVVAIIAATILVSATVLLCMGIADGIGELLGGRQWAGDLITGGLVVGGLLLGCWLGVGKMMRSARDRTRREYEQRRSRN